MLYIKDIVKDKYIVYDSDDRGYSFLTKEQVLRLNTKYKVYGVSNDKITKFDILGQIKRWQLLGVLYDKTKDNSLNKLIGTIEDGDYIVDDCNRIILLSYSNNKSEIVISDIVNKIYMSCFHSSTKLEKIYIPDSVNKIDSFVFSNCINLSNVRLSKNIKKLESLCFFSCISLVNIEIPEGVEELEDRCFEKCLSLKTIKIPNTVKKLYDRCFYKCKSLEKVILSDNLESLGDDCFTYCDNLSSIVVSKDVYNKKQIKTILDCYGNIVFK